jgi:hypothetical protein
MEVTSVSVPSSSLGGATNGNGVSIPAPSSPTPTPTPFPTIEPERVVDHLAAICEIALGSSRRDLELPGNLLHKASYGETISRCTRFANDTLNVLYIQKDVVQAGALENGNENGDSGEHPSIDAAGEDFCIFFLPPLSPFTIPFGWSWFWLTCTVRFCCYSSHNLRIQSLDRNHLNTYHRRHSDFAQGIASD